ncbi:MAG: calcium/sodium antiporter [Oscillospiraceae bacterium]|nr:calcium/sodium antiporter [Oscillospiraceae bacterium]
MVLLVAILLLVLGFALLIKGADVFVSSSVGIAKRLKVPPVIIGLTIVAMGTSAPEIVISVTASLRGANALAISNVVGSNSFNLMFIIGLCALIRPMPVKLQEISKDFWVSIIAAALLLGLKLLGGEHIPRLGGAIMLAAFAVYMVALVRKALKARDELGASRERADKPGAKQRPMALIVFLAVLGCAMIVAGGQLTVDNATQIALNLGITERVIGLTVVAIGTSLPELITCLVACKRGESEFAIGSIVGSNIFNIMFVLGVAGLIAPLEIDRALVLDTSFLIVGSLVALRFVYSGKFLAFKEGLVMLLMYMGYMVFVLI